MGLRRPYPRNDPETEGVDAYCLGIPRGHCPYVEHTPEAFAWLRGWDECAESDKDELAHRH